MCIVKMPDSDYWGWQCLTVIDQNFAILSVQTNFRLRAITCNFIRKNKIKQSSKTVNVYYQCSYIVNKSNELGIYTSR